MNSASENRLANVHPELKKRVVALAQELAQMGIHVEVVQGLRTAAEQDALYAQGRSKPGLIVTHARAFQSFHNFALATDLCPFKNGKPDWNDTHAFKTIGAEGKKLGLAWGGEFQDPDMPHLQLPGLTIKECYALYRKGGLAAVWREASLHLKKMNSLDTMPVLTV